MKLNSHQDQNVCLDPQNFTWDIFMRKAFTCCFSVLLLRWASFISFPLTVKDLTFLLNFLKQKQVVVFFFFKSSELMIMDLALQKPKSFYLHVWRSSLQSLKFLSSGDPTSTLGAFLAHEVTDPSDTWSSETLIKKKREVENRSELSGVGFYLKQNSRKTVFFPSKGISGFNIRKRNLCP